MLRSAYGMSCPTASVCLSVVCLWRCCTLGKDLNFSAIFLHRLIRKAAARRGPNCIRKTRNTFSGTRVYVPPPKCCEKLLPRAKFYWNLAILWWVMVITIFYNMTDDRHIMENRYDHNSAEDCQNSKNFNRSSDCHRVPNLLLCISFHQIW